MTRAATWWPSQRLLTFRRSATPAEVIETSPAPTVGHVTLYQRRLLERVAHACGSSHSPESRPLAPKCRLMTRLLTLVANSLGSTETGNSACLGDPSCPGSG
jgi:hypothetical protein